MTSARQSLERIKQRQQDRTDQLGAAKSLEADVNGDDLKCLPLSLKVIVAKKRNWPG